MSTCRIASGKIYFKDLSAANQPYLPIGNAQLSAAITEEVVTLPDYQNPAGGNACSVRDISAVELTMTMYDYDKKNLALAVFGSYSEPVGGNIVAEPADVFLEGITPLAHIPTGSVVVKDGATTYVDGTDYTWSAGGIQVIAGSSLATDIAAEITDPKRLPVTVDYAYAVEDVVEALVASGKTYALMVEAINKANNGSAEVWRFHKVQFGPTGALAIISREFGSFEITGESLPDTSQGVGESQYFKIQQAQ